MLTMTQHLVVIDVANLVFHTLSIDIESAQAASFQVFAAIIQSVLLSRHVTDTASVILGYHAKPSTHAPLHHTSLPTTTPKLLGPGFDYCLPSRSSHHRQQEQLIRAAVSVAHLQPAVLRRREGRPHRHRDVTSGLDLVTILKRVGCARRKLVEEAARVYKVDQGSVRLEDELLACGFCGGVVGAGSCVELELTETQSVNGDSVWPSRWRLTR